MRCLKWGEAQIMRGMCEILRIPQSRALQRRNGAATEGWDTLTSGFSL